MNKVFFHTLILAEYDTHFLKENGSETKEWGDLYLMWKSFYEPQEALKAKDKVTKSEDDPPLSVLILPLQKLPKPLIIDL